MRDEPDQVLRRVQLGAKDLGCHKVNAKELRALFTQLVETGVTKWSKLKVWRLAVDDELFYPFSKLEEALDRHEVIRLYCTGEREGNDAAVIEIDLVSRSLTRPTPTWFELYGKKSVVDQLESTIREHVKEWHPTDHAIYHNFAWGALFGLSLGMIPLVLAHWLFYFDYWILYAVALLWILVVTAVIGGNASSWTPTIWFDKPGGLVDRRHHLPRKLTIGMFGVLAVELIGAFIYNALSG